MAYITQKRKNIKHPPTKEEIAITTFGGVAKMTIENCAYCIGTGRDPNTGILSGYKPCPVCNGHGERTIDVSNDQLKQCPYCIGTGRDPNTGILSGYEPCPTCGGWGLVGRSARNLSKKKEEPSLDSSKNKFEFSNKIFIVHGHDELSKEQLARFLTKIGLDPIILHEQPNHGRTLIEKFEEECHDVGYAFVIMTADDVGMDIESYEKMKTGDPKYGLCLRARQNVLFELGFFFAKLGRNRVCCLLKKNIEKPADIEGIVYIPFKEKVDEKFMDIVRELQPSYKLDLSKI
jgi:predicted nucleotide-binding protein